MLPIWEKTGLLHLLDTWTTPHNRFGDTFSFWMFVCLFTFQHMATMGFHFFGTGLNFLPLWNSRRVIWILKCYPSLLWNGGESEMVRFQHRLFTPPLKVERIGFTIIYCEKCNILYVACFLKISHLYDLTAGIILCLLPCFYQSPERTNSKIPSSRMDLNILYVFLLLSSFSCLQCKNMKYLITIHNPNSNLKPWYL